MFVLSHASVAAQLEAFFSVDGGLENSKEWVLESGEDIIAGFSESINHKHGRNKLVSCAINICKLVLGYVTQDHAGAWESESGTHDRLRPLTMLFLCLPRGESGRVFRPRNDDWTLLFPSNECTTMDVSQMQRSTDNRC